MSEGNRKIRHSFLNDCGSAHYAIGLACPGKNTNRPRRTLPYVPVRAILRLLEIDVHLVPHKMLLLLMGSME